METFIAIKRPPDHDWAGTVRVDDATGEISGKLTRRGQATQQPKADPPAPKLERSATDLAVEWLGHEKNLLLQGPVEDAVHAHRYSVCTGLSIEGKRLSPACQAFKPEPDERSGFCALCQCGNRERAKIGGDGVKLKCPTYQCPIDRWGIMPGTGIRPPAEMAAHVIGIIKSAGQEVVERLGLASHQTN